METNAEPPENASLLSFDLADADHATLVKCLSRICKLLDHPATVGDNDLKATLDLFVGAVYALIWAKHTNFVNRPVGTSIEPEAVVKRATEPASGHLRLVGPWIAGFHFNSGLLRLAGVYHRALKIVTNNRNVQYMYPKTLLKLAPPPNYPGSLEVDWPHTNIGVVYEEVNDLKHTPDGTYEGRKTAFAMAVDAADELLILFEGWDSAGRP